MIYFEWDENKRDSNIIKHGIDFIDAIKVFSDPDHIRLENIRNGEKRYQIIGSVENIVVLLVVYAYRNEKKRIISARKASKQERAAYYSLR